VEVDSPEPCRVCCGQLGATQTYTIDARDNAFPGGRTYRFADCISCGSVTFLGDPEVDYVGHTDHPLALRDYLELNASVDGLAALTVGLLSDMTQGRLADIGCGFGFGCDAMRRLRGWDVVGYEPSDYGAVGHELLGYPLRAEYFDASAIFPSALSAVVASEVVEHLDDPRAFFATIGAALGPEGRFVLTTPNAALLVSRPWDLTSGRVLGALSPGYHRSVFSRAGLELVLRGAGFDRFTIYEEEATLRCVTGIENHPFPTVSEQIDLGLQYVELVLQDLELHEIAAEDWQRQSLAEGMRFRRFRYLIDLGRYDQARSALVELGNARPLSSREPETFVDFMEMFRCFEPALEYYKGMLEFISGNPAAATESLERSIELCVLKIKIAPSIAVTEEDLVWRARFHVAAIEEDQGMQATALAAYQNILDESRDHSVPADIVDQCRARVRSQFDASSFEPQTELESAWLRRFRVRARGKIRHEIRRLLRRAA
jgi:SAM-dependent methyltransferase